MTCVQMSWSPISTKHKDDFWQTTRGASVYVCYKNKFRLAHRA